MPPRRLIGCHVTSLAEMHTACDYRLEVPLTLSQYIQDTIISLLLFILSLFLPSFLFPAN